MILSLTRQYKGSARPVGGAMELFEDWPPCLVVSLQAVTVGQTGPGEAVGGPAARDVELEGILHLGCTTLGVKLQHHPLHMVGERHLDTEIV